MRASMISLIARAQENGDRTAIIAEEGIFTYNDLLNASAHIASGLLESRIDLHEERVAFLTPRGFTHVAL